MSNDEKSVPSKSRARIGQLAILPLFFKLDGKRIVLAGGGEPSLWKAELLSATGGLVEVFAETFDEGFASLAAQQNGSVRLVNRRWTPGDLKHAALAIGSFDDEEEGAAFASAARAGGVPVNVVDRPALCDFQFGAIVNRSPLVVGISTDGAAPVFGQAIRSIIEGLLPESFALWAAQARDLRRQGNGLGETQGEKRRFWQRFTDMALKNANRAPDDADLSQLASDADAAPAPHPVTIIDAREGVDALTLGAVRALRTAEDIFIDDDVADEIAGFARREARRHSTGTAAGQPELIEAIAVTAARGDRVVWLTTHFDPEQAARLRAAGISVVVIRAAAAS